jgi:pimeloyl-ACP methyl ester carboxylesterase
MPIEKINGVGIFIEEYGSGDTLVLVHGSWVDHMDWPFMVPLLSGRFRVVIYDRRGHSQSERLTTQGSVNEDAADLAAIIERAGAPAHVLGNSMGACISLRLAGQRPALFRTLMAHEPPAIGLLRGDPTIKPLTEALEGGIDPVVAHIEAGRPEEGARHFVEMIVGPGFWDIVPEDSKRMMIDNAPTFVDETRDPESLNLDTAALSRFERPVLLTDGSASPPFFAAVLDKLGAVLPNAQRRTFEGAGHIPHVTHPQVYAEAMIAFIEAQSA